MANRLDRPEPPALPLAPDSYNRPFTDQNSNVLRLFFNLAFFGTAATAMILSFWLITAERQQHTIILLNTSPIRDTEIVVGKFLASFVFLAVIVSLSVYMPLLIKVHGKISWSEIFVGYIGLLMVGAAVIAIGLFASAMSKNMLVAALGSLGITVLLGNIFQLAKRMEPPLKDVFRELVLEMGTAPNNTWGVDERP